MTAVSTQPAGVSPKQALVIYLRAAASWLRRNTKQAFIVTLIGFVSGWLVNFILMSFYYDGYHSDGNTVATGEGNVLYGMVIWGLFSTLMFGLVAYWRAAGTARFFKEVANFPVTIVELFKNDGRLVWTHMLWGAAASLIASYFIDQWMGLMVAAFIVSGLLSTIGCILVSIIVQLWLALMRGLTPLKAHRATGATGLFVGLLTASLVLLASFFISNTTEKAELGLICLTLAIFIAWRRRRTETVLLLLLAPTLTLFISPYAALADDGGFKEAGNLLNWFRNGGLAGVAYYALFGGFAVALGSSLGWIIGNANSETKKQIGDELRLGIIGELSQAILKRQVGLDAYNLVEKSAPFLADETKDGIASTAMKQSVAEGLVGGAFDVAGFAEAAGDAYYTHKFAQEGNVEATAISAANTTGSIIKAASSLAAGVAATVAVASLFATAPAWVPIAVGVVATVAASTLASAAASYLWDNYGQDKATDLYRDTINQPPGPTDTKLKDWGETATLVAAAAAGGATVLGITALALSAPAWVPLVAGYAVAGGVAWGLNTLWN
jgi:hypothetical protein